MPYVTNGNIYAPVMMLAEKAADLIAGDTPLPPEPIAVLPPRRFAARGPERGLTRWSDRGRSAVSAD